MYIYLFICLFIYVIIIYPHPTGLPKHQTASSGPFRGSNMLKHAQTSITSDIKWI